MAQLFIFCQKLMAQISILNVWCYNCQSMKKRPVLSEQSYEPQQDQQSQDIGLKYHVSQNGKRHRWNAQQNFKYATYLRENEQMFENKASRRKYSVFSRMSQFMGNRTTGQAKSHHQKMLKKHKEVRKIIEFFQISLCRKEEENSSMVSAFKASPERKKKLEKQVLTQRYDQSLEGMVEKFSLFQEWQDYEQSKLRGWLQEF